MKGKFNLSTSITIFISLLTVVCLSALFIISSSNTTSMMKDSAIDNMQSGVNSQKALIEEFVDKSESQLKLYAKSDEIIQLLKDPDNAEKAQAAFDYTARYATGLPDWEGLYASTMGTKVLTHLNSKAIGMVLRKDDSLTKLQNTIKSNEIYTAGIIVSPASQKLCLPMYYGVYDSDGKTLIGFVGGGPFASILETKLNDAKAESLDDCTFSMINVTAGNYIFNEDETKANTEVTESEMLDIMNEVKEATDDTVGHTEYKADGNKYLTVYSYIADKGWLITATADTSDIYASANSSKTALLITCIVILLIMCTSMWLVIKLRVRPLTTVTRSLDKLKDMNISQDNSIRKYVGQHNEIGKIATATDKLTLSFQEIVNSLNSCIDSISETTEVMNETSKQLAAGVEDNAATTEELSAGIISTNSSIENVKQEVDKMFQLINIVNEKVQNSNNKSKDLIDKSDKMYELVNKILDNNTTKMETTSRNINDTVANLNSLTKINDMASQILDITSQTNLLSLNASIEAARAGDAGKGFAVVADEIGKLASVSSETATSIQSLCEESNHSIDDVHTCFDEIVKYLKSDIAEQFKNLSTMAKEYKDAIEEIKDSIDAIDSTSNGFKEAFTNIQSQIDIVQNASSDNEQGIEEIIEKNNSTMTTSNEIVDIVDKNNENTERIKSLIDQFKK